MCFITTWYSVSQCKKQNNRGGKIKVTLVQIWHGIYHGLQASTAQVFCCGSSLNDMYVHKQTQVSCGFVMNFPVTQGICVVRTGEIRS